MKTKSRLILTTFLAITGAGMLGSGLYLQFMRAPEVKSKNKINTMVNNDIPIEEDLKITLKELKLSLNQALSMDIQNYIEEPVENSILQRLTLDTSKVDMSKVGTYTYFITYQDKIFEGMIIVEENTELAMNEPIEETLPETNKKITLKNISLKLGDEISKDVSYYVNETLTETEKQQMTLDISSVTSNKAGSYQYSITYNGMFYTGSIAIVEDQVIPSSPKEEEKEDNATTQETESNQQTTEKDLP